MGRTKGDKALGQQDDVSGALAALAAGADAEGVSVEGTVEEGGTGETLPSAEPGDDHTTEFDRRLNTLFRIAEEAEFESGSLVGDIRDGLLDIFKHRVKPWAQHSADEQRDVAKALETIAKTFIRKTVRVVAEQDDISVEAVLKGHTVKGDTFVLKAEAKGDEDTALQLFRLDGKAVVIISADATRFTAERKPVTIDPDQRALEFSDAAPAKDAPPMFVVTTVEDGERLYLDADADAWTEQKSAAGRWEEGPAGLLAKDKMAEARSEDVEDVPAEAD